MVTLYIDDIEVSMGKGSTVFDAAQKVGVYIPTLCHHPELTTFGGCRVCMVEANGKLVTACRAPVAEGMVVRTDAEGARRVQRMVVELMLTKHNEDCQTCVKDSNCKLQEVANYVGIASERMAMLRRSVPEIEVDESNPFFNIDRTRCILCGICIRTCEQINGVTALDFAFRGENTAVATLGNKQLTESTCESCGECLVRCPTGALARKNHERPNREVKSVCGYCGVGCGIHLGVRGDRVVSIRGDQENSVNDGQLCVKGRFGYDFINHRDRLTTPLIKRDGEFEEASWDEALDLVASRFKEIIEESGPKALGGISSARCTNEDNYLFMRLIRSLGTNNLDHCARL
jgi:formate dehydrogenase major subunit